MKHCVSFSIQLGNVVACSILLFSAVSSTPFRYRRQSTPTYTIDTLVVVDNIMYSRFQQWINDTPLNQSLNSTIKQYVSLVVHQANVRLATMTSSLNYQIRLQIVDIRLNLSILTNAAGDVPSDNALDTFRKWLQSSNLSGSQDHAVLFTGHTLAASVTIPGEANKGRAYTKQMCNNAGYSSTIIQENGGFQSVLFLVHELGHSLGADHDSASLNCTPDRYIMSAIFGEEGKNETNQDHPWYFSPCSIDAIRSLIKTPLLANCLNSSLTPIPEFNATSNSASGQLYTADTQCQMIYGKRSRVCYASNLSTLQNICDTMYCLNPTTEKCDLYTAAESTSCGNRTWCQLGRCVPSANAPSMDPKTCPTGDSVEVFGSNNLNCSEAMKAYPYLCDNETYGIVKCCASCKQVRLNPRDCTTGDSVGVFTNNNLTCSETIKASPYLCYDKTYSFGKCWASCKQVRLNSRGCEYGDRIMDGTCERTKKDHSLCSGQTKTNCCRSCNTAATTTLWSSVLSVALVITLCLL